MHLLEIHHKCIELAGLSMNHIKQVNAVSMHLLNLSHRCSTFILIAYKS